MACEMKQTETADAYQDREPMPVFDASQIRSVASSLPRERVHIPEWGCDVWVRAMTAGEADRFGNTADADMRRGKASAQIVVLCLVDENGARMFTDDDIDEVAGWAFPATDRIVKASLRLTGLSDEGVADAQKK